MDFLKLRTLCLKRFVSPLRLAWGSLLWLDSEVLCMIIQLHFVQLFLFYLNLLFFVVSMMCTLGKPYKTKTRVNLGIAQTLIQPPSFALIRALCGTYLLTKIWTVFDNLETGNCQVNATLKGICRSSCFYTLSLPPSEQAVSVQGILSFSCF